MYEYFQGPLKDKQPTYVVVDIQGIGYKLYIPINLFGSLPHIGNQVFLYASWVVREASQTLYGFASKEERDLFELLLTLSGIGPKTALGVIGHFTLTELEDAVRNDLSSTLSRVPGIGKKTAEKLIVDLRGRLKISLVPKTATTSSKIQDALQALLHLGYSQTNAEQAVKKASEELSEESDLPTLITAALKQKFLFK